MTHKTVGASLCALVLAMTTFAVPSVALAETESEVVNEETNQTVVTDDEESAVEQEQVTVPVVEELVTEEPVEPADAASTSEDKDASADESPEEPAQQPETEEPAPQGDASEGADEEPIAVADESEASAPEDVQLEASANESEAKPSDGWADETLKDGKKGRVYYRDGKKLTGYQKIDGSYYYLDDKTGLMVSAASHEVDGALLLFGEDGTRVTGSGWKSVKGTWYYLGESVARTGWLKSGGTWYYLDTKTGAMKCAESFVVDGVRYVANGSGACPSNAWVKVEKDWYLTGSSCAVRTNWVKDDGTWYYLDPKTGIMKSGEVFKVNGTMYVAKASGACPENAWVLLGNKWYLTNGSCAVRTGWAQNGGTWYYLDTKTGVMKSNTAFVVGGKTYVAKASGACPADAWVMVGKDWYLTDGSCAARIGWAQVGSVWYYLSPAKDKSGVQGKMKTGLIEVGGKSYFLTASGAMAANRFVKLADGSERYANADGSLGGVYRKDGVYYNPDGSKASGWLKDGNKWYYIDDAGKAATGWLKVKGTWYWFDTNGVMATGERTIDGKKQYFKDDGAWVDADAVRKAIVNAAYSQIGAAYTEANDYYEKDVAFNCSGFSYWCYKEAGFIVPRKQGYYSYYWNEENKEYSQMWWVEKRGNWTTNVSSLNPGDLVFFSPINDKWHTGHVGVYVGDSQMIDAFPGYGVSKRSVYQSGFVGGGSPIF